MSRRVGGGGARAAGASEPSGSVIVMSAMGADGTGAPRCPDRFRFGRPGARRRGAARRRASSPWPSGVARPLDSRSCRLGVGIASAFLVAYSSTYSWPVSSRISYITSSMIWRTSRSSPGRRSGSRRSGGRMHVDRLERASAPWRRAAGCPGAHDADRDDRAARAQGEAGGAGVPLCSCRRPPRGCPRGRCRTAHPARARRAAVLSALGWRCPRCGRSGSCPWPGRGTWSSRSPCTRPCPRR